MSSHQRGALLPAPTTTTKKTRVRGERVKLDYALDPLSIKTATTTTLMSLLDFATKLARFLVFFLPLATVGFIEV